MSLLHTSKFCCCFCLLVCLLFVVFCLPVNIFNVYLLESLFLFTSEFCYHRERESSCDGCVSERDVDLERTYRYHAVNLGVLTVAFITTTLVTIKEQNGNFFLLCYVFSLFYFPFSTFISILWFIFYFLPIDVTLVFFHSVFLQLSIFHSSKIFSFLSLLQD